jgi:hypothetical protein
VLSLQVRLSAGTATIVSPAECVPAKDTKLTGILESKGKTRLVVRGRQVDVSQIQKVWRGPTRIQLENLKQGEKVKVWGTLRGSGLLVAEEIKALTSGQKTWTDFSGTVESVGVRSLDVRTSCDPASYLRLTIAGKAVITDGGTTLKWSDGTPLDPGDVRVGDHAHVEGWTKQDGTVLASKLTIDRR